MKLFTKYLFVLDIFLCTVLYFCGMLYCVDVLSCIVLYRFVLYKFELCWIVLFRVILIWQPLLFSYTVFSFFRYQIYRFIQVDFPSVNLFWFTESRSKLLVVPSNTTNGFMNKIRWMKGIFCSITYSGCKKISVYRLLVEQKFNYENRF